MDIYDNVDDIGETYDKLKEVNLVLMEHIGKLENDILKLMNEIRLMKTRQDSMIRNISELFNTAKAELGRRDKVIAQLRSEINGGGGVKQDLPDNRPMRPRDISNRVEDRRWNNKDPHLERRRSRSPIHLSKRRRTRSPWKNQYRGGRTRSNFKRSRSPDHQWSDSHRNKNRRFSYHQNREDDVMRHEDELSMSNSEPIRYAHERVNVHSNKEQEHTEMKQDKETPYFLTKVDLTVPEKIQRQYGDVEDMEQLKESLVTEIRNIDRMNSQLKPTCDKVVTQLKDTVKPEDNVVTQLKGTVKSEDTPSKINQERVIMQLTTKQQQSVTKLERKKEYAITESTIKHLIEDRQTEQFKNNVEYLDIKSNSEQQNTQLEHTVENLVTQSKTKQQNEDPHLNITNNNLLTEPKTMQQNKETQLNHTIENKDTQLKHTIVNNETQSKHLIENLITQPKNKQQNEVTQLNIKKDNSVAQSKTRQPNEGTQIYTLIENLVTGLKTNEKNEDSYLGINKDNLDTESKTKQQNEDAQLNTKKENVTQRKTKQQNENKQIKPKKVNVNTQSKTKGQNEETQLKIKKDNLVTQSKTKGQNEETQLKIKKDNLVTQSKTKQPNEDAQLTSKKDNVVKELKSKQRNEDAESNNTQENIYTMHQNVDIELNIEMETKQVDTLVKTETQLEVKEKCVDSNIKTIQEHVGNDPEIKKSEVVSVLSENQTVSNVNISPTKKVALKNRRRPCVMKLT